VASTGGSFSLGDNDENPWAVDFSAHCTELSGHRRRQGYVESTYKTQEPGGGAKDFETVFRVGNILTCG
jgi:hypothetical protein